MRIFKNTWFERFARKNKIDDNILFEAVQRAENGQIDADLGGGVIKLRIARTKKGKSGGYRTIILYRAAERAFFIYGFSKRNRNNFTQNEELLFKKNSPTCACII